jgi:hypothetical protein
MTVVSIPAPVVHAEHAFERYVGIHRDLLANLAAHRLAGPARDDVRLNAAGHQPLHVELGGLGFLFAERVRFHDVGQRDEAATVLALLEGEFADGLDVIGVFHIAHRPTDLDEDHVRPAAGGQFAQLRFTSPVTCGIICTSRPR